MAFQFYCPHGHLLQGEETQIGQPCMCPYCQTEFLIPESVGDEAPSPASPGSPVIPAQEPYAEQEQEEEPPLGTRADRPGATEFFGFGAGEEEGGGEQNLGGVGRVGDSIPDVDAPSNLFERGAHKTDPDIFHIPCPRGHILESPREMLNQEVICPECESEFVLRWEKSIEGRREKAIKEERRERKLGNAWMNWAIAAAVLIGFGVLVMIAMIAASSG